MTGQLKVTQNDSGNTRLSVTLEFAEATSLGVAVVPRFSSLGDYVLNFPAADDLSSGVMLGSVA